MNDPQSPTHTPSYLLNPDVIQSIASYIHSNDVQDELGHWHDSHSGLLAFMAVCKPWYQVAHEVLYKDLYFPGNNVDAGWLLAETLALRPDYGRKVRTIDLSRAGSTVSAPKPAKGSRGCHAIPGTGL